MKTTLFEAITVSTMVGFKTNDGYIPFQMSRREDNNYLFIYPGFMTGEFRVEDQEIEIASSGEAIVLGITNSFLKTTPENKEEHISIYFFTLEPLSKIHQLKHDSDNYKWMLKQAEEYGSYGIDGIGGCIEIYDGSTAKEVDQAITKMRLSDG